MRLRCRRGGTLVCGVLAGEAHSAGAAATTSEMNMRAAKGRQCLSAPARVLLTFREPGMSAAHCGRRGLSFPGSRFLKKKQPRRQGCRSRPSHTKKAAAPAMQCSSSFVQIICPAISLFTQSDLPSSEVFRLCSS